MIDYKNMVLSAQDAGISTEKIMVKSIDSLNEMLCKRDSPRCVLEVSPGAAKHNI